MKLSLLQAFCAAAEEGSISGAARRMYLAQPTVSERIAELEREAGVPLLVRSSTGVRTSPAGALVLERAEAVLRALAALEADLHALKNDDTRSLRFAACYSIGEHLAMTWLQSFGARRTLDIEVVLGNNAEIVGRVSGGDVRLGLVAEEGDLADLETTLLFEDELIVIATPWQRSAPERLKLREVLKQPYIVREAASTTRRAIADAFVASGLEPPQATIELGSTTAIIAAVQKGMGFSVVSRATVLDELARGTLWAIGGFAVERRFVIAQRPGSRLTAIERQLRSHLIRSSNRAAAGRQATGAVLDRHR
ncbi:MAG TPA: LysR family transcriptional regulator [Solirubrobacteraceae bacterium]